MFKRTTQQRNVKGVKPTSRKLPIYKAGEYEFKEGDESVVDLSKGKLTIKNDLITSRRQFTLGKLTLLRNNEEDTTESSLQLTSDKVTISQIVKKVVNGSDSESISELKIYVKPNNTNSSDKDYGTKTKPVEIILPNTFNTGDNTSDNNTAVQWYLWSNADEFGNTMDPAATSADSGKAFATYVNVISDTNIENDGVTLIGKKTEGTTTTAWETASDSTTNPSVSTLKGYIRNQILTVYREDIIDTNTTISIYVSKDDTNKKYIISAKDANGDNYTGPIYYPFRDKNVKDSIVIVPDAKYTAEYSNPVIFGFISEDEKTAAKSTGTVKSDTFDDTKFNVVETMTVPPSTESSGKITQYSIEYRESVLYGTEGVQSTLPSTNEATPVIADSVRYNDNVAKVTTTEASEEKASNKWIINKECKFTGNLEYSSNSVNIATATSGTYHFGEKDVEITSEGSLVCAPVNGLAGAESDDYKLNLIGVTTIDIADGGSIECSSLLI